MGQRGRLASPVWRASGLDALDLPDGPVQGGGHGLVHVRRGRRPRRSAGSQPQPLEEALQLLMGDAGEDGGVVRS